MDLKVTPSRKTEDRIALLQPWVLKDGKRRPNPLYYKIYGNPYGRDGFEVGEKVEGYMEELAEKSRFDADRDKKIYSY